MHNLSINTIINPTPDSMVIDKPIRILDISDDRTEAIVISCEQTPKKPWPISLTELKTEIECNSCYIAVEQTPDFILKNEDDLSDVEKKDRDHRWSLISGLVDAYPVHELITKLKFGTIVKNHAKSVQTDPRQVYRLLFRYWVHGQIKNALLSDSSKIGRSKNRKITQPQGRKPKYLGALLETDTAIVLKDFDLAAIKLAYDRFINKKHETLENAHDWMVDMFYSKLLPDGSRGEINRGTYPTPGQLKWQGKKLFDADYMLKKKLGTVRYNKDGRALVGTAVDGLVAPCHRYEIDSTIADIYLVHRMNRSWLIGRPVVYVVVDTFSRMIVGLHVGLEGPNWNGARHALFNAFTPKKQFCARYGVEIEEDEWPCHHLPAEVSADRAELLSGSAETMANTLGITVKIAPPYRPDWKPIVESRFKILNKEMEIRFLPGGVDARRLERGDRKYELDAIFDLDQFTHIIITAALIHNESLRLPHLLTPSMYKDDLNPTPINLWNWGFNHGVFNARIRSDAEIKIGLLPSCEVPIKRGGIYFKKLFFTCALAKSESWLSLSHNNRTRYIKVWYDPNSVDYVWIKVNNAFLPLTLVPNLAQKFRGYRLDEVEDILAMHAPASPDHKFASKQRRIDAKREQEELRQDAEELMKQAPDVTQTEFKRNIREKRSYDQAVEAAKDTLELGKLHGVISEEDQSAEPPPPPTQRTQASRGKQFLNFVLEKAQDE